MSYRKKRKISKTKKADADDLLDREIHNPATLQDISSARITSGLPYQRPIRPARIRYLQQHWDPRLLKPLDVMKLKWSSQPLFSAFQHLRPLRSRDARRRISARTAMHSAVLVSSWKSTTKVLVEGKSWRIVFEHRSSDYRTTRAAAWSKRR